MLLPFEIQLKGYTVIWHWVKKLLFLLEGVDTEQQEGDVKLVKPIFIGRVTTVLYLRAKQSPRAVQALRRTITYLR